MAISQEQVSLEEFLRWPEEKPALEYFDGQVTQKVSPKGPHGVLQSTVAERINLFARPRRIAFAFTELRATFGGFSPVPDVAVYTWDRIPRNENGEVADDFVTPPDLIIEIVSPGQRVNTLVRRCLWYVDNGVRIALLVDPKDRSVIDFRAGVQPKALHGADLIDFAPVVPGLELAVQELFDWLKLP